MNPAPIEFRRSKPALFGVHQALVVHAPGLEPPACTCADFEQSDVLLLLGSDPCLAHPVVWQRVWASPLRREIIVIDPRMTEAARHATQHLALKPGSDVALLHGLANLLIQGGHVDHTFIEQNTTGYIGFVEFVRRFTPDKVAAETGLTVGDIYRCAQRIGRGRAVSFSWPARVNGGREAIDLARAILNLALLTGWRGNFGAEPAS